MPRLPAALVAVAVLALPTLAACDSSASGSSGSSGLSGSSASAGSSSAGGSSNAAGSSGAATGAVPSQDVVSAVNTDVILHGRLPAAVRARGSITFGTPAQSGTSALPYSGRDDGRDVGLEVDLRNAVGKVLGLSVNVRNATSSTIIPGTRSGRYDVGLDNLEVTAERSSVVDVETYANDGQAFLGSRDSRLTRVSRLTDLCGYTVATTPGSTFQQVLTQGAGQCASAGKRPYTVRYFADDASVFRGLANGTLDASFGSTLSVRYDAAHVAGTRFLGQLRSTPVGFVTARNSPLTQSVSDAVNTLIFTGDYQRIMAKWGLSGSAVAQSQVNPKPRS